MSGASLKIGEHLLRRIHAHGVETYPHECCGALLGYDGDSSREVTRPAASRQPP